MSEEKTVTLLSLQEADLQIQTILKNLVGDLQGKTVAGLADLRFLSDEDFERRLEEKEPPKSSQDWVRLRLTMGFVQEDLGSKIVWIRESQRDGSVIVHEAIHVYAHSKWKAWKKACIAGQALDEGTTEYFTRKIAKVLKLRELKAYNKWVAVIEQIIALISEEVLAAAYFSGNVEVLESKLESILGYNLFPWLTLVQQEDVEQAKLLLPGHVSSNTNLTPPSTSTSRPSLPERMRDHMASLIRALAEGTSIESQGIQSWDLLVSGAGQAAHSNFRAACGHLAVLGAAQYFVRLLEPKAAEGRKSGDEEEAVEALVKATSKQLVARAFILGQIDLLKQAHTEVEEWLYHMNRPGGLGLYPAMDAFK